MKAQDDVNSEWEKKKEKIPLSYSRWSSRICGKYLKELKRVWVTCGALRHINLPETAATNPSEHEKDYLYEDKRDHIEVDYCILQSTKRYCIIRPHIFAYKNRYWFESGISHFIELFIDSVEILLKLRSNNSYWHCRFFGQNSKIPFEFDLLWERIFKT